MHKPNGNKLLSAAAFCGALFLMIGTFMHPMHADPNVPLAAFSEYAESRHWIASHLLQLLGVVFIIATLILLSRRMDDGPASDWAALGTAGAVASLAVASALQAVDGIALKSVIDAWAAAAEPDKSELFHAAFGVRQIEAGLAGIASVVFGLTVVVYGIAFLIDGRAARWVGFLAVLGGVSTVLAGIAIAYSGFSELSMMINMPASLMLIVWLVALGLIDWRGKLFLPAARTA